MAENIYMAGDIVKVVTTRGEDICLIVKCSETYATTLKLLDDNPCENSISIMAKTKMYADCGRFGYAYYNKIVDLVRSMKDDEFDKVRRKIAETLCLSDVAADWGQKTEHPEWNNDARLDDVQQLCRQIDEKAGIVCGQLSVIRDSNEHDELIKAQAELELMHRLYNDLLDRMAGA